MASEILRGFRGEDQFEGGDRLVTFDDGILIATVHTEHADYAVRHETRYFQLTEVVQRWTPVEGGDDHGR